MIQDMCVPHHVFGCLLQGHHAYENWVIRHHRRFQASEIVNGQQKNLEDVMKANAFIAMDHEALLHQPSEEQLHQSTTVLLTLAQQSGAAALLLMEEQIKGLVCQVDPETHTTLEFLKEA